MKKTNAKADAKDIATLKAVSNTLDNGFKGAVKEGINQLDKVITKKLVDKVSAA